MAITDIAMKLMPIIWIADISSPLLYRLHFPPQVSFLYDIVFYPNIHFFHPAMALAGSLETPAILVQQEQSQKFARPQIFACFQTC